MGGFSSGVNNIIVKLKLDPTDMKAGYQQARTIMAGANAEMLALDSRRIQMRGQLESQYSASQRAEIAKRISDLQGGLAATVSAMQSKTGAEKAALAASADATRAKLQQQVAEMENYRNIVARLGEVTAAMRQQQVVAKEAQSASVAFQSRGISTGVINTPFAAIQAQISSLTPGLSAIQSRLGGIFNAMILMGGGIKGASQGFDEMGAASSSLLGPLSLIVGVAAATGAGMLKAGLNAGEWAHNLSLLSAETGISMKDLEGFQYVGRTTGLTIEDMTTATKRLATSIVTESPALAQLGIRVKDAGGNFRSTTDVLFDLSAAFEKIPTQTEKIRVATELLGRGGQKLIDTLSKGPEALRALFDEAVAKGPQNLEALDESFEKTEKASADFHLALLNLESRLGFSMGIWATAESKMTNLLRAFTPAPAAVAAAGSAMLPPQVQMDLGIPPALRAPGAPPSRLTDQRLGAAPPPAAATAAQIDATSKADEALAIALGKQTSLASQLAAAQAEVNKKRKEYLDLEAQLKDHMGVTEPRNKAEIEYAAAITRVTELKKQQASLDKENAKWWEEHDKKVGNTFKKPIGTPGGGTIASGDFLPPVSPFASKPSPGLVQQQARDEAIPIFQGFLGASGVAPILTAFMANFSGRQLFGGGKSGQTAGRGFSLALPPDAATATMGTVDEQKKLTDAQLAARVISPDQAVKNYQAQKAALEDVRKSSLDLLAGEQQGTDEYVKQLDKIGEIDKAIKGVGTSLKDAEKLEFFTQLMQSFDQLANAAGKFSAGLGKAFSEVGASIKLATTGYLDFKKQVDANNKVGAATDIAAEAGPGIAAAFGGQGIGGIFSSAIGMGGAGAGLGFLAGGPGGAAIGGSIGAAVGAVTGGIGAWKTAKQADAMRDVTEISDKVKDISAQLSEQRIGLVDATNQLFQQLALAKAQTTTGKGGNQQQMEGVISSITAQIVQLQAQAAKTIVDFKAAIGMFAVPVGVQSYAAALVQIQVALKAAAGAGADAADQVAYLNGSLNALKVMIGDTLTSEQQNVVGMMLQTLDLVQQRAQIVQDEQLAEQNIQMSLGLSPTLTPGQQAAKQIAILRRNEALQLAQIDQQKALLQAQLDGQMQLFGWTQKDLDAVGAKTKLLQEQVDLQKMVTAETVKSLEAQMAYFASLAAGSIPNLPAGLNVPGAVYPSGGTYNITINVTNPKASAQDIADKITQALNDINIARQQGFQPL